MARPSWPCLVFQGRSRPRHGPHGHTTNKPASMIGFFFRRRTTLVSCHNHLSVQQLRSSAPCTLALFRTPAHACHCRRARTLSHPYNPQSAIPNPQSQGPRPQNWLCFTEPPVQGPTNLSTLNRPARTCASPVMTKPSGLTICRLRLPIQLCHYHTDVTIRRQVRSRKRRHFC